MRSASVGKKSGEGVVQDERGYTCKNIGCSESFKWRAQLQRHLKGCSFPPPLDTKKYVKLADKSFQCKTCGHNEKHQPNILRHLKFYCGKVKRKKLFKCSDCQKEFPYNSLLLKHIEVHEKTKAKTCDKCKQTFRRSDHFLSHQQKGCYSSVDFTKNCFADVSASMCLSDIYDIDIEPSYDLMNYELTITDTDIVIEEKLNKRGTMHYHTNRRIVTCTVRTLQKKLEEISINLSLGSILSLKPFFIAYPTDREMSLCMCKLCLNARLYFRPLMAKARKDEDESTESITGFLMGTSTCPNTEIGYHSWDCVRGKCKNCKKITPSQLKCSTSEETLNVFQFIATETKYQKISQDGTVTDKVSKKTQKIPETISYKELYSRIVKLKRQYLVHRYQVCNDYFHWKIILDATQFGPIYHLDYSENITQLHREEAQSSHFNKNQYSLHCSVQHNSENNEYFYHLSDVKKHDFAYTSLVVENLISQKPSELIRVKSDNCSTQYKCRWVFNMWRNLAVSVGKIIITYYGTSGHGKGLVDAMSGFGVKGPLKTAVLLDKFSYNTAQDISNMLTEHFENDPNKHYSLITGTEIAHQRTKRISLPIKDCQKLHMIAYFPDGTITSKINLCSCPKCLVGLFTECPYELGTINYSANVDVYDEEDSDNDSDEDDYDEDYDEESYEDDEWEEFEMRGDVIMEIVEPGTVIALFSPKDANELFFLFRVIDLGFASHDMKDKSNHLIVSGEKYIRGNYLEKISEKRDVFITN